MKVMLFMTIALSGCATVASVRDRPLSLSLQSANSPAAVQSCVSQGFENRRHRPVWEPREAGGLLRYEVSGTIFWIADVVQRGGVTSIAVRGGGDDLDRNDAELAKLIRRCAQ